MDKYDNLTEEQKKIITQQVLKQIPKERLRELYGRKTPFLEDLYIRDDFKNLIPLKLNETQLEYRGIINPNWKEKPYNIYGVRDINLKGRQFGLSTYLLGEIFLNTIVFPRTYSVIIAQEADTTERLFDIVERFWDNLDDFYKPRYSDGTIQKKPKYSTRRELTWDSIDSTIFVGKAGSLSMGRSSTINNAHCTEVPNWPDAGTLMTGLVNSVPKNGNIWIESSAEGYGNWFADEWERANKLDSAGNRLSGFTPRFWSWVNVPKYEATEEETKIKCNKRTEEQKKEEEKIQVFYNLSDSQIVWRRGKILELGGLSKFQQEFPLNADEAFVATGTPYFNRDYLKELRDRLSSSDYDPIHYSMLKIPERFQNLLHWVEFFSVWKEPDAYNNYIVVVDPSEGINDFGDHDYSPIDVFNVKTWEQVAQFYTRLEPYDLALVSSEIALWYNTAVLGVERNNHGHAVLSHLMHDCHYPEMKDGADHQGLYLHQEYDQEKMMDHRRAGYPTTGKNKVERLAGTNKALNDRDFILNSRVTVNELFRFVKKPGGKYGGEGRSHDDTVTTLSIGYMLLTMRESVNAHAPLAGQPVVSGLLNTGLGIQTLENLLGIQTKQYNAQYKPPIGYE